MLGIRPEHLVADPAGMKVQIDLVEPLGSETVLIGRLPDGTLLSVKRPGAAEDGESMTVSIPPAHLHVFDAENGLRLDPAGCGA